MKPLSEIDRLSPVPPFRQLKEILISQIEKLEQDARLPADRVLAKTYGLSLVTVQKVMGELSNEGYIQREIGRGSFVHSRNPVVEGLDGMEDPLLNVAIIYPNFLSVTILEQLNKLEREGLKERISYSHFKLHSRRWLDRLALFINEKKGELEGVVLLPPCDFRSREQLLILESMGIKMVLLSSCNDVDLEGLNNIRCCGMNHFEAGATLVGKCFNAGYTEVLHVRNEPSCYDTNELCRGLLQASLDQGMYYELIADPPANWEHSGEYASRVMENFEFEPSEKCILVFDSAAGASAGIHALMKRGFLVPEEIAVATGDFNENFRFYNPPLSGMRQNISQIVDDVISVLSDHNARGQRLIDPIWIEGGSMRLSSQEFDGLSYIKPNNLK